MDLFDMHSLPNWEDHRMLQRHLREDGWKEEAQMKAARELYNKWREIFLYVESYCDTLQNISDYEYTDKNKELIGQNLFIVAPKIIGAAGTGHYILKMENAAIIRRNCCELLDQIRFTTAVGAGERKYANVIEREMDIFRGLFKEWVRTFVKDGYTDDWGLYI
ncbi:MAG: hypothetical protein H3C48_19085 [Chitinophagaceae bacterium]|nr:hypothetical protein [Chitinophagaceae bacterium]